MLVGSLTFDSLRFNDYALSWANMTAGESCEVEQMPYIAFGANNQEFIYVVSRYAAVPGHCSTRIFTFLSKAEIVGPDCIAMPRRKHALTRSYSALPAQQTKSKPI